MNLLNTILIHGKLNKTKANRQLRKLGNELFENHWSYIDGIAGFTKVIQTGNQYHVRIGKDLLYVGCKEGEMNTAGYVMAIEHMYHEYRHVQQFTTESTRNDISFYTSNDRRMTDIVRRQFICNWYETIYSHTYETDPGEMDAEVYGVQNALTYFQNDPLVSKQQAGHILTQVILADDYGHKEKFKNKQILTVDSLLQEFIQIRNQAVHIPYRIMPEKQQLAIPEIQSNLDLTDKFLNHPKYKYHRKEFDKCTDGRMQDKLLEQTIVLEYPEVISIIPRLEQELQNCQRNLESRFLVNKNEVIPISKIQYAAKDFTEAVESISENQEKQNCMKL